MFRRIHDMQFSDLTNLIVKEEIGFKFKDAEAT